MKEEIKVANSRSDEAEDRIEEAEERLQHIEEATMELLELQKRFETRLVDQEGRSRRENVRIHGLEEGAEDSSGTMTEFVEKLLREKLELPPSFPFQIERAHRALPPRPSPESPPRSIVVKFMSFRVKEEILKKAWQKKGFMYEGKKVFLEHDYAPEVLKKRKEYTEAKRVLREKKIRFQTPFPTRLRVFYVGETRIYNTAEEATKDMAERGLQVAVTRPAENSLEKIRRLTWKTIGAKKGGQTPRETIEGYKQRLQGFRRSQDEI
ncbi:uncharacterized protein LOC106533463 [Austrofundulus limnaeus]|uniref:Uncharacterized protein LOC106533463 n=1 Tax=Austrofundulus limnaeus TaxID=52670 RepID=A0A2I4CZ11_AUSLI|nr:PREDICTED: uncharacterized protein LOC106533463 [Austrofundulus limnaeus]